MDQSMYFVSIIQSVHQSIAQSLVTY